MPNTLLSAKLANFAVAHVRVAVLNNPQFTCCGIARFIVHFRPHRFLPPSITPSPARGKEKRAFDALRLWHRQAPWEEGKPKARKGAFPLALLPVFELGGFQTEERLEDIKPPNLAIQRQPLYHKSRDVRIPGASSLPKAEGLRFIFPMDWRNLTQGRLRRRARLCAIGAASCRSGP